MNTDKDIQENSYFDFRNVNVSKYKDYQLPQYLINVLPIDKNAEIIDIGCGFGQTLLQLKKLGYTNIKGIDISNESVNYCTSIGLNVIKINNLSDYKISNMVQNDFAIMSHVLEHIDKNEIINTLKIIKDDVLKLTGKLCVMVPNAQSNTSAYWRYEDFTHTWLFTAGSLIYVLKAAGFKYFYFLDPKGVSESRIRTKYFKLFLLLFYDFNMKFWNKVTGGSFHEPSPIIYTWELKAIASNLP